MNTQLDLELLQTLLFGREVVNISVGQIVRLAEETGMFVDDAVRKRIELLIRHADHPPPENVVIVLPVVETNKPIFRKGFNFFRAGIDHPVNEVIFGKLPVHEEKVREHLTVEEYDRGLILAGPRVFHLFLRFEMHLRYCFQTCFSLIRAVCSESQNRIAHVIDIVRDISLVRLIHNVSDEVYTRFCVGTDLLGQCFLNQNAKMLLILDLLRVNHFFSLQWQATTDRRYGNIIALR